MFSKEGYIGFEAMRDFFDDISDRVYVAYLLEDLGKSPERVFDREFSGNRYLMSLRNRQLVESGGGKLELDGENWEKHLLNTKEDYFVRALIFHSMFAKALMKMDTLLCSPTGTIMRPDDYVFIHEDRFDWIYPRWPLRQNSEFLDLFRLHDERGLIGYDIARRYCFVDFYKGLIFERNHSVAGFRLASHFANDTEADRYFNTQVRPFLNWSLVWNEESEPENYGEFLEDIGAVEERWDLPKQFETSGFAAPSESKRGPKPTAARQEFFRVYPDGKPEGVSGDAIAAELTEKGFPISGRMVNIYHREIKGK